MTASRTSAKAARDGARGHATNRHHFQGVANAWAQVRRERRAQAAWPADPHSYAIEWLERHYTPIKITYSSLEPRCSAALTANGYHEYIHPVAMTARATLRTTGEVTSAQIYQASIRGRMQCDWSNIANQPGLAYAWIDTWDIGPERGVALPLRWGLATHPALGGPLELVVGNPAEVGEHAMDIEITLYVQGYHERPLWAQMRGSHAEAPLRPTPNAWPSRPPRALVSRQRGLRGQLWALTDDEHHRTVFGSLVDALADRANECETLALVEPCRIATPTVHAQELIDRINEGPIENFGCTFGIETDMEGGIGSQTIELEGLAGGRYEETLDELTDALSDAFAWWADRHVGFAEAGKASIQAWTITGPQRRFEAYAKRRIVDLRHHGAVIVGGAWTWVECCAKCHAPLGALGRACEVCG